MKNKSEGMQQTLIATRLDVIIRLLLELCKNNNKSLNKTDIVKLLNSLGLTPTEIANILGLKSRTNVAGLLYTKNKK